MDQRASSKSETYGNDTHPHSQENKRQGEIAACLFCAILHKCNPELCGLNRKEGEKTMSFAFRLSASRNRPIAPSVRIEEDGQLHIELKQYNPKNGIDINFFDSTLYEGIKKQYQRLGLVEEDSPIEGKRVWKGSYTENARRYLMGLARGKVSFPAVKEENRVRELASEANHSDLFTGLQTSKVSAAEGEAREPGTLPADEHGRDKRSHTGSDGQLNETGQKPIPISSADASRERNIQRNAAHTGGSRAGQLDIFASPLPSALEVKEAEKPKSPTPPQIKGENYRIDSGADIKRVGQKTKLRHIIESIKLLKTLESEERPASKEEQEILARFSGFGGVANIAFRDPEGNFREGYQELGQELEELLSKEELHSARRSTPNAFYTSRAVMKSMYDALYQLGVSGGSIRTIEPGAGIGNFMGIAPEGFSFVGVEKESISARIAALLYPEHELIHKDYKDTETALPGDSQPLLQDNSFDVVVGNIPFGKIQIPHKDGNSYRIHDYFLHKSLDKLREGGMMAVVTSAFTMDKGDSSIREMLEDEADLVAAFRLPNQAFAAEGTEVLTDILLFQKRSPDKEPSSPDWQKAVKVSLNTEGKLIPSEEGVLINEYFLHHPEHILGDSFSIEQKMYARESLQVKLEDPTSLSQRLASVIQDLPTAIYQTRPENTPDPLQPVFQKELEDTQEHIREGSFVMKGRQIHQIQGGELKPVIHRGKVLTTDSKIGKRVRDYISVRDAVKEVIQSQKEELPETARDRARSTLDYAYDLFARRHGPINAVNLFESDDPKRPGEKRITRRFVNVNDLRGDPDIYLVMSIEKYNEKTNQAEKGDIFLKDIVAPKRDVVVESPEEGLIASLQQYGKVDSGYIADMCACPESQVLDALQNRETPLIYFDPAQEGYTTREDYLSGNIREKLKAIESYAGDPDKIAANKQALEAVLPEPIPYEAVTANLGAGWIAPKFIREFAQEQFGGQWQVRFNSLDAKWSAESSNYSHRSQEGDPFAVGEISGEKLFIQTLEGKSTKIYKTVSDGEGGDKRVLDREKTLLARQTQEKIRQRFKQWVFEDTDRAEEMARDYNETFNSLMLRKYDGSFLSFEGMNSGISLRDHQKDAVYRTLCEDSCLLAHATGAGKTFSMAAAGMNLKRMGLRHKPLYVVPNHMLEQFSREFLMLYPDANILVTTKKDLQKENRKLFTAKAATGDWDAVIMTHSSFNKVGMSPEFQQTFIQSQIESYEKLLEDAQSQSGNNRRYIKDLETSKQNLENRLDSVVGKAARSKDKHIFFEELGIDHIFIDEAHVFKNLQIQTKMDRVAGLNTSGSERSLNLFMMTEYLNNQDEAGITFATATPITNSLAEMYTMMRYLIPHQMEEMGIKHFDSWAATFGEVVTRLEIKPDASTIDFQSRFAKFHNVPELLQLFNMAADIKRSEDLDLPVPKASYETIAAEPSEDLLQFQRKLQERYQDVRNGRVEPTEDNALKISTEGRKAALNVRLVDPLAADNPGSKVNLLVDRVYDIWEKNKGSKATQMIFSDMGVHAKGDTISIYEDILTKLVERGIPREELANINDYNTDIKKAAMFEKMRRGEVRVLIGSTQKMGTGTNVQGGTTVYGKMQGGLIALHHLDAPWRPADMEQRDGRIIRQGNPFPEIEINSYITKQSFDAVMWQKLEQKQHFISQIMKGTLTERTIDDIGSEEAIAFAEVAAIASGNPEILELAEIEAEIRALSLQEDAYQQKITRARREGSAIPGRLERYGQTNQILSNLIHERDAFLEDQPAEGLHLKIGSRQFAERKDANMLLKSELENMYEYQQKRLATVQGLDIYVQRLGENELHFKIGYEDAASMKLNRKDSLKDSTDLVRRLDNLVQGLEKKQEVLHQKIEETNQAKDKLQSFLEGHENRTANSPYDSGFEEKEKLAHLRQEKERLENILATTNEPEIEKELLEAEVSEAKIVGESKEIERAA